MIPLLKNILKPRNESNLNSRFEHLEPVKLHVGCGTQYKADWVNIDNNSDNNIKKLDINWDLSKGLPFTDASIDFIYHEHFIEHLSYEEGLKFLSECWRILKVGGVMRIACPDLDELISDYLTDTWREKDWVKNYQYEWMPSRCYMINACMNQDPWGHKYVYNKEDLKDRLAQSGFGENKISESSYQRSDHVHLEGIDSRNDSMFIEATK